MPAARRVSARAFLALPLFLAACGSKPADPEGSAPEPPEVPVAGAELPTGPESPSSAGVFDPILAALTEIGDGARPCEGLVVRFHDGNGLDGFTTLTVDARAVVVDRTRPGGTDEHYEGALEDGECAALALAGAANGLDRVKDKRELGVPDETRPRITFGATGVGSYTVELWANDVDDFPAFDEAKRQILSVSSRVSGGKVTY